MNYDFLTDIRIMHVDKRKPRGMSFFGMIYDEQDTEPERWTVIYHTAFKKWIITNDIDQHGLKGDAANVQIIGFADSLNAIMFVIWEHQKSIGMQRTILEEIREKTKIPVTEDEWKWGRSAENPMNQLFKFKPVSLRDIYDRDSED
jgi:hypothetical protein